MMVLSQQPTTHCNHTHCPISSSPKPSMQSLTHISYRMFEGGPPKPKGMPGHLVIEYFSLLIMETRRHGLMGGFGGNTGLGLCSSPRYLLDVNLVPQSREIYFIDIWDLGMVLHGKPQFWQCGPAPRSTYITPLLLIIIPFISPPTWVRIPPLDLHRVVHPLPFAHTLGWAWNDAPGLMQLKRKVKAYLATFNMKMYHKMHKRVETNTFSTWAKANT